MLWPRTVAVCGNDSFIRWKITSSTQAGPALHLDEIWGPGHTGEGSALLSGGSQCAVGIIHSVTRLELLERGCRQTSARLAGLVVAEADGNSDAQEGEGSGQTAAAAHTEQTSLSVTAIPSPHGAKQRPLGGLRKPISPLCLENRHVALAACTEELVSSRLLLCQDLLPLRPRTP